MKKHGIFSLRIFIVSLFVFTLIISSIAPTIHAYEKVPTAGVAINGKMVNGIDPIKMNDTYYLPLNHLAKTLSYNDIRFEKNTMTYEITDGSTTVRLTMGGSQAKKGNEYINIDPPRWINETAYISLAAGSALFNSYMYFKPENGSIQVEKPATKYRIQAGDTLWVIARSHHTTVNALKSLNNLTANIIYPGDILKLPTKDQGKEIEPIKEKQPIQTPSPSNDVAQLRTSIITEGQKYLGAGYKFGATLNEAPRLFDCSSYTQFVFGNNGIKLPRTSRDQAAMGTSVTSFEKGDLLFFTTNDLYSDGRVGHVGIYMGNGDMIHASTSKGVSIVTNVMNNSYWKRNYLFAKRIIQ